MRILVVLAMAAVAAAVTPVVAQAAVKSGSYSGATKGSIYNYGSVKPVTDEGKVTFKVAGGKVSAFKVTGQKRMCGPSALTVDVKVPSIQLSAKGKGSATFMEPSVGVTKVSVKVSAKGTATGTLKYLNLCTGKATFSAKKK